MAGWGTGSFENEHAQAWLGGLKSLSPADVAQTFARANDVDYMEERDASIVIAAAEVLAAMKGAPNENNPRQIESWVGENKESGSPELIDVALQSVEKVRRNSELKDLWLQAEGLNEWTAALQDLQTRLRS